MKKFHILRILPSISLLLLALQLRADEITPDFIYGDFGCVITSEENAEVAIYYNNEVDFVNSDEIEERNLIFPSNVEYNSKTYTVTSLCPNYKWITGITDVELPETLKTMPEANPLKYYKDLGNISLQEGNKNFMVLDGCLYSADATVLYAVPRALESKSFTGDERVLKIHPDALYETLIEVCDFSKMKNLDPLDTSFFKNMINHTTWTKIYYPPTINFNLETFVPNVYWHFYLPSSINDLKTGYILGGEHAGNLCEFWMCQIDTYFNEEDNLVINDGFFSIDKGRRLVAYNTYDIPYQIYNETWMCSPKLLPFPEGIEEIAGNLFSCNTLKPLDCPYLLPSTLKHIEDYSFEGYKGIETILISLPSVGKPHYEVTTEDNGTILSRDAEGNEIKNTLPEGLETMGKGCFMRSLLREITVPNVKYIPELVFAGCQQLDKITFGEGVEEIELSAIFAEVTDPETEEAFLTPESCVIECLSTTPPRLLSTDFDAAQTYNNTIVVPDKAVEAYKEAWGDKFANIITKTVSGINAVSADNTDNTEIFYNLNGQRVEGQRDTLAPGLYICRKADKSTKVIIR